MCNPSLLLTLRIFFRRPASQVIEVTLLTFLLVYLPTELRYSKGAREHQNRTEAKPNGRQK